MTLLRRLCNRGCGSVERKERKDSPELGCPPRCPRRMVVRSRACGEQGVRLRETVRPVSCPPHPSPGLSRCHPRVPQKLPQLHPQAGPSPAAWAEGLFSSFSPPRADRRCSSCLTSPRTGACRSWGRSEQEGSEAGGVPNWALATVNTAGRQAARLAWTFGCVWGRWAVVAVGLPWAKLCPCPRSP